MHTERIGASQRHLQQMLNGTCRLFANRAIDYPGIGAGILQFGNQALSKRRNGLFTKAWKEMGRPHNRVSVNCDGSGVHAQ